MMSNVKTRKKTPDRRDVWNASLLCDCKYAGKYEMPTIPACEAIPPELVSFSNASIKNANDAFIHFYQDDYKYERIWRDCNRYLPIIQAYGGAVAPDFSLYRDMPLVQQMYNVFRSRVLGYWWASNGIAVIPNARWGDERTYEFCFDGLPKDSVIAIGTHGCVKHKDDKQYFLNGFIEMLGRLEPKSIVLYGAINDILLPPLYRCNVEIIRFESDFSRSRKGGGE